MKSYCSVLRQQVLVFDQKEGSGLSFSPAEEGIFVVRASDVATQHGLKVGDLIVAIDSVPLAARVCGGQARQEATFHERLRDGAVVDVLEGPAHQTESVNFRCPDCWRGFDSWPPCLQHHLAAWRMERLETEGLPSDCHTAAAELQPPARDVRLWMRRAAAAARGELPKPQTAGISGQFQGLLVAPEAPPLPAFGQCRGPDSSRFVGASTVQGASVPDTSKELQPEVLMLSKDENDLEGGMHLHSAVSPRDCAAVDRSEGVDNDNGQDDDSSGSEVFLMGAAALKQTHARAAPQERLLPSPSLCSGPVDDLSKETGPVNKPADAILLVESLGTQGLREACVHTSQTLCPDTPPCTPLLARPIQKDLSNQVSSKTVHVDDPLAEARIDLPSKDLHSAEEDARERGQKTHIPGIPSQDCKEGNIAQKVFDSGEFQGGVANNGNGTSNGSKLASIADADGHTHGTLAAPDASQSSNTTFRGQGSVRSLVREAQIVFQDQEPVSSRSQEAVSMPRHEVQAEPVLNCDSNPVSNKVSVGRSRQVVVAADAHDAGISDGNNQVSVAGSWQSRRRRSNSRRRSVSRRRSLSRPLHPAQPQSWWEQFWEMRRQRMRGRAQLVVSMPHLGLQDLDVRSFTSALDRLLCDLRSEPRRWGRGGMGKVCRLRVMLELDMSDNNIGDSGAICLCQWLLAHRQEVRCRVLRLSRNAIGDDALEWLAQVSSSQDSAIEVLHLSHNHVTESGAIALLLSIATHPSEAYPCLNRNGLFAPAVINLDGNSICKPEALFAQLQTHVGLRACLEETYTVCTRRYTACPHVHAPGLVCADTLRKHAAHAASLSTDLFRRIEEVHSGGRRDPPAIVGVLALSEQQLADTGGGTWGSMLRKQTHRCTLYVDEEFGAGLELEPVDEGLRVVEVFDYPGQTGLQSDDLIVAIDTWPLCARACPGDDEQNCRFGRHFRHGACLDVQRCQRSRKAPTLGKTTMQRFRCPRCSEGFTTWQPCLRHLRETGHGPPLKSGARAEDPAACARRWMNDCVAAALSSVPSNLQQEQVEVELIGIPGLSEGRRCSSLLEALTAGAVRYCNEFGCVLWTWPTGFELRLLHTASEGAPPSARAVTGLLEVLSFYLPELEARQEHETADEIMGPADWTAWLQGMLGQDEDVADAHHASITGASLNAAAPPFVPRSIADNIAGLRVVVLCGLPGSGKSTLAGELSSRLGWSVVNQDALGSRQACMKMARACLKEKESCVVIDRCNVDVKQRSVWVQLAMHDFGFGADALGCIWLDVSVDECEQRVMRRFGHSTLPAQASSKPVIHGFAESWQSPSSEEGFVRVWRMSSSVDMEMLWAELLVSSGHEHAVSELPQQASPHLPLACQQKDACLSSVNQPEVIPLHDHPKHDDSLHVRETATAKRSINPVASYGSPLETTDAERAAHSSEHEIAADNCVYVNETAAATRHVDPAASCNLLPEATNSERTAPRSDREIAAARLPKQASPFHPLLACQQMDDCLPLTSKHEVIPLHNRPQNNNCLDVREIASATGPCEETVSCGSPPEAADHYGGARSMDQSKLAPQAAPETQPCEFWRLPLATLDISDDEDLDDLLPLNIKPQPADNLAVRVRLHAEASSKIGKDSSNAEATGSQTGNVDTSTEPAKPDVTANFWRLPLPELHDDPDECQN